MNKLRALAAVAVLVSCKGSCGPVPAPDAAPAPTPSDSGHQAALTVANQTDVPTTVYIAFGSDSVVLPGAWSFCTGSGLNCSFVLGARDTQVLPLGGAYLNATFAFDLPVGCGATKAEFNVNNPKWYATVDISMVDGYSNNLQVDLDEVGDAGPVRLGPPLGKAGNEKVVGLFPYGCDICVDRQNPPCGISKGADGCKSGGQYNPDVICQYQGATMGGGAPAVLSLVK